MRLIDADALKDVMIDTLEKIKVNPKMDNQEAHLIAAFHTVGMMIDDAPTIEERKTGRWIYDNEAYPGGNPCGHYDCDQCGESVPHKTNFCPNCGAKMEVEHEDR